MPYSPRTHRTPSIIDKRKARERYDAKRPSAHSRGYDGSWRKVRAHYIQNNPLCEMCLKEGIYTPMQELHHIIKLKDAPHLRDDRNNLMSLCKSCHSKKTAAGE